MGKFSILSAIEMVEEEKLTDKAIAFQFRKIDNPYWGLKCNRGLWLTRFPKDSLPEDPEFTMAYVRAGGGFDGMSHWGINPVDLRKLESKGWNYEQAILLAQGVPENLCQYEGVTPQNYKTLDRGLKRAEALGKMQVEYTCSVWTLGSMPIEKFLKRLFKNGIRVTFHQWNSLTINYLLVYRPYYEGHRTVYGNVNTALEAVSEGGNGRRLYNIEKILPEKFLVYCRRCCTSAKNKTNFVEPPEFVFSSLKAAKVFAQKASIFRWINSAKLRNYSIEGVRTTAGLIFPIHPRLLLVTKDASKPGDYRDNVEVSRSLYSVREVAGFSVCRIGSIWFVWSGGNFSKHIEGTGGLRSVIELAEKRRKKDSLILSLNDIRNDRPGTAGFCLIGTKGFLENKMPFVYRMVVQYNNWTEIPEDIMEAEFHLASKDIFDGYPSPVN